MPDFLFEFGRELNRKCPLGVLDITRISGCHPVFRPCQDKVCPHLQLVALVQALRSSRRLYLERRYTLSAVSADEQQEIRLPAQPQYRIPHQDGRKYTTVRGDHARNRPKITSEFVRPSDAQTARDDDSGEGRQPRQRHEDDSNSYVTHLVVAISDEQNYRQYEEHYRTYSEEERH